MGWTVRIQHEDGSLAGAADFDVPFEALPQGASFPISSSVARYYLTLLNPQQLRTLVDEWDEAAKREEFRALLQWKHLRDVAADCAAKQLYLRFTGD